MSAPLQQIYQKLLSEYGPQGWWPVRELANLSSACPTTRRGYHPGDYSVPYTETQRFEICAGAVLTQNTAWPNVEKALSALAAMDACDGDRLLALDPVVLAAAIRPAGYYTVKAEKLRRLALFLHERGSEPPSRADLLSVWGIGPETADSILLYAYGQPEFTVDSYTRRLLSCLGLVSPSCSYDDLKAFCMAGLPRDVAVFQECHALFVAHAKVCHRGAAATSDPLLGPLLKRL